MTDSLEATAGNDSEYQTIQTILFLGECIRSSTVPDNIDAFCKSSNSKIRYLALRVCLRNSELVGRYFRIDDPSSSIRQIMIGRSASFSEIASSCRDANPAVKVAALKALSKLKIGEADQNAFVMDLVSLINDKEHEVRLLFSKLLKKLDKLTSETLLKLFDKEDIGTLIYAAEDEYEDVRAASVISLRHIMKEGAASDGFDFLMDILNDDSLRVREMAMRSMYEICKKYTIVKEADGLFGVLICLREMNPVLKRLLLKIIARIRYKDVSIVKHLFSTNLEDREIVETVRKVVRRNLKVFLEAVGKNPFVFSRKTDRKSYKIEYLVDLVIIREAKKIADFHISDQIQKGLGSTDLLLKTPTTKTTELDKIQDLLADFLLSISGIDAKDDRATKIGACYPYFQTEMKRLRTITAFGKFIKSYLLNLPNGIPNILLVPYRFNFGRASIKKLVKQHEVNLMSREPGIDIGILLAVKELVAAFIENPKHSVLNEYSLGLPETVTRQSELPVEFEVKVGCKTRLKNIFLVLESGDSKIFYPVKSTVHVLLDDCLPLMLCYLACRIPYKQSGDNGLVLEITQKMEIDVIEHAWAQ